MQGRLFSIKKTTILRLSFIINFILYFSSLVFSFTILKVDNLWFFSFCVFMGLELLIKSALFKHDSSCYFGISLFFIGFFYFYCYFLQILNIYIVFLLISFSFASFSTYSLFRQPFQLYGSLSLFFASISTFIYIINVISFSIFLALLGMNVLLLIGACIWLI